jgi:hypothetical protein
MSQNSIRATHRTNSDELRLLRELRDERPDYATTLSRNSFRATNRINSSATLVHGF